MNNDLSWEMILNIVKDWNSGLCLSNVYPEIISDENDDTVDTGYDDEIDD